ncbi:hypothetical protein [Aquimarina longa]|uniref:hypothetical protein n=1 Tax=Aquimarina longa TaxID=1080221 RepID=UPI000A49337B|nr:hypothetical protein [Aquimarina longa]
MELTEIVKKHNSEMVKFFSDINLFTMKGISPFNSSKEVNFPFIAIEDKEEEKLLSFYFNSSVSDTYSFKWDGQNYLWSESYLDDDASKWLEYILITSKSIFKVNAFIDEKDRSMFINDIIEFKSNSKIMYFFPEKSIQIREVKEVVSLDLEKISNLIKKINYNYDEINKELVIKKIILQNLIDDDNKSTCKVLNQKYFSFLWDIFLNRERGVLVKENEC